MRINLAWLMRRFVFLHSLEQLLSFVGPLAVYRGERLFILIDRQELRGKAGAARTFGLVHREVDNDYANA
jgi:hypothetical protein